MRHGASVVERSTEKVEKIVDPTLGLLGEPLFAGGLKRVIIFAKVGISEVHSRPSALFPPFKSPSLLFHDYGGSGGRKVSRRYIHIYMYTYSA